MIQEHLVEEGNLHYADFITDLIKVMVSLKDSMYTKYGTPAYLFDYAIIHGGREKLFRKNL